MVHRSGIFAVTRSPGTRLQASFGATREANTWSVRVSAALRTLGVQWITGRA